MAINSMYRALRKAGFNKQTFPRLQDVMFISESEAAAHYVARYYRDEKSREFLKVVPSPLIILLPLTSTRRISISFSVTLAIAQ
jgi:hypothetical protein